MALTFFVSGMAQNVLGSAFKFRPDHWLQGPEKRDEIASVLIQLSLAAEGFMPCVCTPRASSPCP